jgi:hypothetical protein
MSSLKERISLADLQQIALKKIREHRRCHDVEDITICPLSSNESGSNWAISVGYGGSNKSAASKAALYVEQELSFRYELDADGVS